MAVSGQLAESPVQYVIHQLISQISLLGVYKQLIKDEVFQFQSNSLKPEGHLSNQ
jgi:hypothetical protein